MDAPIRHVAPGADELLLAVVQYEIPRVARIEVYEELLDQVASITEADDEVRVPVMSVVLHQIPQNRSVTDRHEGFRNRVRMLPEARTKPAAKQHDFHVRPFPPSSVPASIRRSSSAASSSAAAAAIVSNG